jgi:hypothetical protein
VGHRGNRAPEASACARNIIPRGAHDALSLQGKSSVGSSVGRVFSYAFGVSEAQRVFNQLSDFNVNATLIGLDPDEQEETHRLQIHQLRFWSAFGDDDMRNLMTLCLSSHEEIHGSTISHTDWIERPA